MCGKYTFSGKEPEPAQGKICGQKYVKYVLWKLYICLESVRTSDGMAKGTEAEAYVVSV